MKTHHAGLLIVCVLVLSLTACAAPPTPEETGLLAGKLTLSPGISRTWNGLKTLEDRLQRDIQTLQGLFEKGQHGEMAMLLETRRAVITGIDYEKVRGIDSAGFWGKVHSGNVTLEIRIAHAYVSNVGGPHPKLPFPGEASIKVPEGKKLYNAVATIAAEIHIIERSEAGATLHNASYLLDVELLHQWCCVWGEEEVCPPSYQAAIAR